MQADVAVLEEPEHLNWYHHGRCWTEKFNHVVGVVHTNYLDYARREESGSVKEKLLKAINSWVCQAHCHKVRFKPPPATYLLGRRLAAQLWLLPFPGGEALGCRAATPQGAHGVRPWRKPYVPRGEPAQHFGDLCNPWDVRVLGASDAVAIWNAA